MLRFGPKLWCRLPWLGAAVLVITLAGCGPRHVRYHVVRQNADSVDIDNVVVRFGSFETLPTFLQAGTSSHLLNVGEDHPFPDRATVVWTTPQGVETSKTMRVPAPDTVTAAPFNLVFRFAESNGVSVTVQPAH